MISIKKTNIFFLSLVIFVLIITFMMILPFWKVLLSAAVLAYLFFPLYKWLNGKVKHPNLSAFIMLLLIIVLVILPSFFIITGLINESVHVYSLTKSNLIKTPIFSSIFKDNINFFGFNLDLSTFSSQIASEVEAFLLSITSSIVMSIPHFLLNLFVFLFALFFFFRDGDKIVNLLRNLLEIHVKHKRFLESELNNMTKSIVYGSFAAALAQSIAGLVGYYLFGVSTPIIWALATFFVSLLPLVGPSLIWLPLGLLKLFEGYVLHSSTLMFQGSGLLVYGFFVISWVDNLVRPRIVSGNSNMHPLLVLISILGGLYVFGFIGVLAGPLVLVALLVFVKMYLKYGKSLFVNDSKRGERNES